MTRRGFSLLELLTALAVVAALLGLTLTAVQKVRASAARAACQNNLRQQGLAVLGYEAAKGRLPPGGVSGPFDPLGVPDGANHGLWPAVLGQLGENRPYKFNVSWDHPTNRPATAGRLPVLECPAADHTLADGVGVAHAGPVDVNPFLADLGLIAPAASFEGPLPVNGRVKLTDLSDGAANTLLVVGACGRAGVAWPSPETTVPVKEVLAGGPHPGGANASFADGSVRFLAADTPLRQVAALATRAGGEAVGE